MSKLPKERKCRHCGDKFTPPQHMMPFCSPMCKTIFNGSKPKKDREKIQRAELKAFNQKDKRKQLKKAIREFNNFIRLRDAHLPCISCKTTKNIKYDAGHYKPAGGFSYLRFDENNCHKQCTVCNTQLSANLTLYRPNLIIKIGIKEVERLEQPNQLKRWSVEELQEVIDTYRAKIKELKEKQ